MSFIEWVKNLGKPKETSVPVKVSKDNQENEEERKREIREIEVTLNLLEEEARVIYRR